ncbi:MAG: methyltransferase domain-containing protein [Marinicella sp.]
MSEEGLSFTGERFLPSCEREIWYEHYHRYTMAKQWVKGQVVLDAACGEGYGSFVLADDALSVTGVDISKSAIHHAKQTYTKPNLKYVQSDVLKLNFDDNYFDVIVSFETLEHLAQHDELLAEFKRVLKPDGVLLISTPDKQEYSDKTGFNNEYHVKELYRNEFADLINHSFKHSKWYGQKLMFSSSIWELENPIESLQFDFMNNKGEVLDKPEFKPVYFIVAASDEIINAEISKNMYCFTEQSEQIYGHYNAVIRAHIKAENECETLQQKQQSWLQHPIIGRCIKWFDKEK